MPLRNQIEAFRNIVTSRRLAGESLNELHIFLNERVIAEGGTPIGLHILKRQLLSE